MQLAERDAQFFQKSGWPHVHEQDDDILLIPFESTENIDIIVL